MDSAKNNYETLRAVDPGAAVESGPVAPKPGHLGVPPLVGSEWSVPERQPYEHGETGGETAQKWGPPREDLDRRTALLAAGGPLPGLPTAPLPLCLRPAPGPYPP